MGERGYPEEIVDGQLKMVERKNREELLRCRESGNKEVDILFVVDYHLHLKWFNNLVKFFIKI